MRRLCFLFVLFCPVFAFAQDLIIKKDGEVIKAKVMKVGSTEVDYKKWSNQNGPLYSIEVNNVFVINYENGEKETFENVSIQKEQVANGQQTPATSIEMTVIPAEDNARLLALYNEQVVKFKRHDAKNKKAKRYRPIWGITSQSVLSDQYITISFLKQINNYFGIEGYIVQVQNKTDKNLYIDLANSFKIDSEGNSTSYLSNKTYTTNTASGVGAGLNMGSVTNALGVGGFVGTLAGGVNVGGGKTGGTSVIETQERMIIVPPHAKASLPCEKKVIKNDIINISEELCSCNFEDKLSINRYEFKVLYDENNAVAKSRRIITYSTTPDFSTYSRLNIEFYLRALLGININVPSGAYITEDNCIVTNWDYLLVGASYYKTSE